MNRRLPFLDVALAVVLVVPAVLDNRASTGAALAAAVWVSALAWRSTAPLVMVGVTAVGMLAYGFAPDPLDNQPFVASLVIFFSVGHLLDHRRRTVSLALLLVCAWAMTAADGNLDLVTAAFTPPVLVLTPALAGWLLRRSHEQSEQLRLLQRELETEREARAVAAVAEERNRIARELHDVISHAVSVMVVQSGAAEQQLPEGSVAREQVRAARLTGKRALHDLRRQLGVLRREWDSGTAP